MTQNPLNIENVWLTFIMRPQCVSKLWSRVALNVRWLSWQHIRGKATRTSSPIVSLQIEALHYRR